MLGRLPFSSPLLDKVHPFLSSFDAFLSWITKERNSVKPDTSSRIGCSAATESNNTRRFQEKSVLSAKVELLR